MILMAGTTSPGGIAQVIKGYARDGIFEKWNIRWVKTHVAGNRLQRAAAACRGFCGVIFWMCRGKVELVHAHAAMRGSFWRKSLLVRVCEVFGVPVVVHLHGSEMKAFFSEQSALGQRWIRSTLERADRVVVLSAGWEQYVRQIAPAAVLTVLPNYSPAINHIPGADRPDLGSDKFIFLFLGALVDRKGIYELLPAFAKLSADYPDVELWMGGTGDIEKVQAFLFENELTNVRLLGWVDELAKNKLLLSANAFVLPSKNENLPMAIIEAMSASLPIITTHVGGIPEMLLNGRDAILVEPGRVDLLYQALHRIRSEPETARQMAINAARRYEAEFSPKIALPKIELLYTQLIKSINPQSNA